MKKTMLHIIGLVLLMSGCTNPDTIVDKTKLLGSDYRLFQETPAWELAKAVEDGDAAKIGREIDKDKSLVNYPDPRFGSSLLSFSVFHANFASAKALLEKGADPNQQDKDSGDSPLMEAARIGSGTDRSDSRFLRLLLKYGGNPNTEQHANTTRKTPLMIACENAKFDYIKILVNAGAKVDTVNQYGDSPLSSALLGVQGNGDPDIIMYLIQKGANFHRVLYKTIPEGESKYITDDLRMWRFEIGSEEYKKKMRIVDFLKRNGMDYWKTKIPAQYFEDYSKEYLEKY